MEIFVFHNVSMAKFWPKRFYSNANVGGFYFFRKLQMRQCNNDISVYKQQQEIISIGCAIRSVIRHLIPAISMLSLLHAQPMYVRICCACWYAIAFSNCKYLCQKFASRNEQHILRNHGNTGPDYIVLLHVVILDLSLFLQSIDK